jgi:glycosyltransferase involved in cell wall biosynthesis
MKIGILTLSLKRGGAERVASLVGTFLSRRHEVYTILFDTTGQADYPAGGSLVSLNLPEPAGRKPLPRLFNTFRAIPRLRRLKRELKLDVVLSFLEPANIPNVLSKIDGCKTVLAVTEDKSYTHINDLQRRLTDFLIRRLYPKADRIFSASKGAGRTLSEKFHVPPEKIRTIYNPVDLAAVSELAGRDCTLCEKNETCKKIFDGPVVLSAGRLTLPKGHWHLIRAFHEVRKTLPNAKLVILGDGELKEVLVSLVSALGLSDVVFFPGYQVNPFCYMKRASVFVLSSLWEGFGNVILESLAVGLPVISTDIRSGPREILAPETDSDHVAREIETATFGLLVPPLDGRFYSASDPLTASERFLSDAIIKMLTDHDLARNFSARGFKRAADFRTDLLLPEYDSGLSDLFHR